MCTEIFKVSNTMNCDVEQEDRSKSRVKKKGFEKNEHVQSGRSTPVHSCQGIKFWLKWILQRFTINYATAMDRRACSAVANSK